MVLLFAVETGMHGIASGARAPVDVSCIVARDVRAQIVEVHAMTASTSREWTRSSASCQRFAETFTKGSVTACHEARQRQCGFPVSEW